MKSGITLSYSSNIGYYLILSGAFVLPFAFGSSQIITGIIVNTVLIISAFRLERKDRLAWVILPSLAALTRGLVFGPATPFLYYFLPVIWFSNWILVSILSGDMKVISIPFRILIAGVSKIVILYGAANLLVRFSIVPSIFLTSMGVMQALTLIGGGVVSYFILQLWLPNQKK